MKAKTENLVLDGNGSFLGMEKVVSQLKTRKETFHAILSLKRKSLKLF